LLLLVLDENRKSFLRELKKTGYDKRISLEAKASSLKEMETACAAFGLFGNEPNSSIIHMGVSL